ncbi:MAG TPA: GIY-YIG nuclease family protein [Mucilaginibacter sp.]
MVFERGGCVYIMANKLHSVLYVGVTSDLISRAWQHKNHVFPNSFTAKYKCEKLVYYCFYPHIEEAIVVEKVIKGGNRNAKIQLVNSINPDWIDLYEELIKE